MTGLFSDKVLNDFFINREAQHHLVSKIVKIDKTEYDQLDIAKAQELRIEKALNESDKVS